MNDDDRDLILDLVEGRLDTEDAGRALARIQADDELSRAYAEQTMVKAEMSGVEPVHLTDRERETLRAALISQLHLEPPVTAPPAKPTRPAWWLPATGVVAAAAVVTAIVVLPSSTTTPSGFQAAESARATTSREDAPEAGSPAADEMLAFDQASADGGQTSVIGVENIDPEELLTAVAGATDEGAVRDALETLGLGAEVPVDQASLDGCHDDLLAQIPDAAAGALVLGADQDGGTTVVHFGITEDSGIDRIVSVDLSDCSVVHQTD